MALLDILLAAEIEREVRAALAEDVGEGDLTAALIPAGAISDATIISRDPAVISGRAWVDAVFAQLDPAVRLDWQVEDGDRVEAGSLLCRLHGPARSLLTGERCALNFLQTLSGTASLTRRYVNTVAGLPVRILDTRKTLPGLRLAQKYAVRCGGGHNHRLGLYDAILIKENHIQAAGSIGRAVAAARSLSPEGTRVEVEVEDLDELGQALEAGADIILLDNMPPATLREAVAINAGRARLEASGGITLETIRRIAETGVDYISTGSLTKDVTAVDLSMRFVD